MNIYLVANALTHLSKIAAHELSYSLAGKLQLSSYGWIVLTVPASLIRGAFDALHEEGAELPTYFAIPVIAPEELRRIGGPEKITERGHSFSYTLGPVRSHDPNKAGISKTWYIQIYSHELKRVRHSYGLEPYIKGYNSFQLPIAIRKIGALQWNEVTKTSSIDEESYLDEPDWSEYDQSAIEKIASVFE